MGHETNPGLHSSQWKKKTEISSNISSPSQVATTVEQLKKKLIFSLGISVWELFCKRLQTFWVEICLIIIFPPCRFFQHYYRKVKQTAKEKKQHSPPVVVIGSNLVNKRCFVVVCKTWAAAPTRLFRQDGVAANPLIFTLQTENPSTSGAPVCGHWFVYRYRAVEGSGTIWRWKDLWSMMDTCLHRTKQNKGKFFHSILFIHPNRGFSIEFMV